MIPHATIAKLNRYVDDDSFARVLHSLESALSEGLNDFELDVHSLDEIVRMDLVEALATMGYGLDYDDDSQILEVSIE